MKKFNSPVLPGKFKFDNHLDIMGYLRDSLRIIPTLSDDLAVAHHRIQTRYKREVESTCPIGEAMELLNKSNKK